MERERGVIAVCLANRAACWLRRKQWRRALADCNRVIRSGCARPPSQQRKRLYRIGRGSACPATKRVLSVLLLACVSCDVTAAV